MIQFDDIIFFKRVGKNPPTFETWKAECSPRIPVANQKDLGWDVVTGMWETGASLTPSTRKYILNQSDYIYILNLFLMIQFDYIIFFKWVETTN